MQLHLFAPRSEPEPEPETVNAELVTDPEWEVISLYTRAAALEDGALVDVTAEARRAGWKLPVAITQALHARLTPSAAAQAAGQSYTGRLWDTVWLASLAARRKRATDLVEFTMLVYAEDPHAGFAHHTLHLWATVGPGDAGEPVVTIGFPSDF